MLFEKPERDQQPDPMPEPTPVPQARFVLKKPSTQQPTREVPQQRQPEQVGLFRRIGERVHTWWEDEDRPGLLEFHYLYLPVWLAGAVAVGGAGVEASDDILGTHLADRMANVRVMEHSNEVFRTVEEAVRDIGKDAGGHIHK
jgi:hypothetical protein